MKCERKGCRKKSFSHAYIDDKENNSTYLLFLCEEHLSELWKIQLQQEECHKTK